MSCVVFCCVVSLYICVCPTSSHCYHSSPSGFSFLPHLFPLLLSISGVRSQPFSLYISSIHIFKHKLLYIFEFLCAHLCVGI
ncbi:hypothetical protein RIF29_31832 [Crotalaria pallida]|uniref:Secreted protein n=1 Tax=Crotalaria pallida TaxID=3830 RepID=A0AAN9EI29_CROPI